MHPALLCSTAPVVSPTHTQTPVVLQPLRASLLAATHRYNTDPEYIDSALTAQRELGRPALSIKSTL